MGAIRTDNPGVVPTQTAAPTVSMTSTWSFLLLLAVFLLLFVPLAIPNPALHIDEVANWLDRVEGFRAAMLKGDYAATVRTEHPGVTTMAFGAVGLTVLNAISPESSLLDLATMYAVRTPIILVNALVLTAAFVVLRRLFDWRVALLAAVLWGASPTLRWYLRLLHIDGMSTTFMFLAFAMLMVALSLHQPHGENAPAVPVRWGWLVAAGVIGGLAGLTRFTAVYLVGMVGVMVLLNGVYHRQRLTIAAFLRGMALPVIVFALVQITTWVALYPGMWAAPNEVYTETVHGIDNATSAHEEGNYYMGQPVDAPPSEFYLWALLIRLTPFTVVGVGLALIAAFTGTLRSQWRVWLSVLVYIAVYTLIMSVQAKKFDRYILPVFPALHLTAAFGWVWLLNQSIAFLARRGTPTGRPRTTRIVASAFVAAVMGYGLWFFPADYAYTNPIVGAERAQHILLIAAGGEGMNEVGTALEEVSGVEGACGQYVFTRYGDNLVYNTPCAIIVRLGRMRVETLGNAYYIVRTISYRQRDQWTEPVFASTQPLQTVQVHGITYAEIYDAEAIRAFIRENGTAEGEWEQPE